MKNKSIILILFVIWAILMISAVSVSAQDFDVDSMSNEQLLQLLQVIMQKLEQDETAVETAAPASEIILTPEAAEKVFSIYENKKLILERLPDWYFYRGPSTDGEDDNPPDNPGKQKKTDAECENYCAYEACDWGNLECYWDCYFPCMGEPYPQWHIDAKNP